MSLKYSAVLTLDNLVRFVASSIFATGIMVYLDEHLSPHVGVISWLASGASLIAIGYMLPLVVTFTIWLTTMRISGCWLVRRGKVVLGSLLVTGVGTLAWLSVVVTRAGPQPRDVEGDATIVTILLYSVLGGLILRTPSTHQHGLPVAE